MATIKSFTDIKQSKVLAGILSIESADMYYSWIGTAYLLHAESYNEIIAWRKEYAKTHNNPSFCTSIIPCWSLAALISVLPAECECMSLEHINYGNNHKKYFMSYVGGENTDTYDNPIDACVAMIEHLHELKML